MKNINALQNGGDYLSMFYLGRLAEYTALGDLSFYIEELRKNKTLIKEFENKVKNIQNWKTKKFHSIWDFRFYRIALYCLCRDMMPSKVVETGVLHGLTSTFILEALKKNGKGKLVSIDLPSTQKSGPKNQDGFFDLLPPRKTSGWIIPERLKLKWNIHFNRSCTIMKSKKFLSESIDIFIHDSEHTFQTMWFELNTAWELLNKNGLLICDNIDCNPSFFEFSRKINKCPLVLPAPDINRNQKIRFAILVK